MTKEKINALAANHFFKITRYAAHGTEYFNMGNRDLCFEMISRIRKECDEIEMRYETEEGQHE